MRRGATDDKGVRLLNRMLTDDERALLVRRQHMLEIAGTPATADESTFEIQKMLSGFPSFRAGEAESAVIEVQYASVLRQFPVWAIRDACAEISSGRLVADEVLSLNPAFPPSAEQVAIVTRREVRAMERELAEVQEVLAGRVEDAVPRPSRAEIEAKLGRQPAPRREPMTDQRCSNIAADLAIRRSRNEAREIHVPDHPSGLLAPIRPWRGAA